MHPYVPLAGAAAASVLVLLFVAFLQRAKLRAEKLVGLLHGSEQRFRTLAASSPVGIFQLDPGGRCVYANARFRTILGTTGALEPAWRAAVHPDDRATTEATWSSAAQGKSVPPVRFRIGEGSGQRWAKASVATRRDDNGAIVGCVGTVEDITESKRIEAQLTHQALHDSVTGLPNRTLFLDRVGMALARTRRAGGRGRGPLHRPGPLQADQRLARSRGRRPPAHKRRPPAR
jgi:PAS domain S-box-containing protein